MSRKTFEVKELIKTVNYMLLNSSDESSDVRRGAMNVLETVLHETGNYNGFRYLDSSDMDDSHNGSTVGIRDYDEERKQWNFIDTDHSRVAYY